MSVRALRELRRTLGSVLPSVAMAPVDAVPLEVSAPPSEPPRMRPCTVVEGERLGVRSVVGAPEVRFAAFLDGAQESHVLEYVDGAPIVWGRVAAVIRARVERRLRTWGSGPLQGARLYVPRDLVPASVFAPIEASGIPVVNTLDDDGVKYGPGAPDFPHPHELLRRAVHRVQEDRDRLERQLAEEWCARESEPLFVDGGVPTGERTMSAPGLVGVVKSHHTMYTTDDGRRHVLALPEGARTSVFVVTRTWGPAVLSWYLRLRPFATHNPFAGLVRIEVAPLAEGGTAGSLTTRADQISRWVLAERYPLSLPDGRWDRMTYGVRDCEELLRAVR